MVTTSSYSSLSYVKHFQHAFVQIAVLIMLLEPQVHYNFTVVNWGVCVRCHCWGTVCPLAGDLTLSPLDDNGALGTWLQENTGRRERR